MTRQFDHLQESSRERLRAMIPAGCPLTVERGALGGFVARTLDGRTNYRGRFQVVAAFILGFVAAWQRVKRGTAGPGD